MFATFPGTALDPYAPIPVNDHPHQTTSPPSRGPLAEALVIRLVAHLPARADEGAGAAQSVALRA